MNRNTFLKALGGLLLPMNTLKDLKKFTSDLTPTGKIMPALFLGHGSPMNGIEDNLFSKEWANLGTTLPVPKAVIVISAHWFTRGTRITAMENPKTIYDFQGFPQALYDVTYPSPGHPVLAKETAQLVKSAPVELDHEWGLDHGTWTIIRHMYPKAEIPVLQLSIDYTKPPQYHYDLAAELYDLRKKGVLLVGSGNMVHNLRILNWQQPDGGYDWAEEINDSFKKLILSGDHQRLVQYEKLGQVAKLAIPTPEHYLPMLYILGMQRGDEVSIFNDKTVMGSVSMTSFRAG